MTTCTHARTVDVTDFDADPGVRVEMCRDCGTQTVRDAPPTRYSLLSPVEVVERTDDEVTVRAMTGDTHAIPAALFDGLYRQAPKATG